MAPVVVDNNNYVNSQSINTPATTTPQNPLSIINSSITGNNNITSTGLDQTSDTRVGANLIWNGVRTPADASSGSGGSGGSGGGMSSSTAGLLGGMSVSRCFCANVCRRCSVFCSTGLWKLLFVVKGGVYNIRNVSPIFWFLIVAFLLTTALTTFCPYALVIVIEVIVGWLISLAIHEFGHAVAAYYGGDHSVVDKGYLELNICRYTHPVMSLLIPLLILCIGGVPFPGGAVFIQTSNLSSANWCSWVSFCGPAGNIGCAIMFACTYHLTRLFVYCFVDINDTQTLFYQQTIPCLALLVWFQFFAVFLNLLPMPPLDGWGIISPQLSSDCWLKRLLENPWNARTAQLAVLALLIILLPRIKLFYEAVSFFCFCFGLRRDDVDIGRQLIFGPFLSYPFLSYP
eukprot:GHVS01101798.1.p1 GENE.GHVS01101798.1~~GHVS01101798.1.p1  ORF type:complete len:401 (-),score=53.70 GHVS01101798.1:537-1739(-)